MIKDYENKIKEWDMKEVKIPDDVCRERFE